MKVTVSLKVIYMQVLEEYGILFSSMSILFLWNVFLLRERACQGYLKPGFISPEKYFKVLEFRALGGVYLGGAQIKGSL